MMSNDAARARLCASKARAGEALFNEGKVDGECWARDTAPFYDLRKIERNFAYDFWKESYVETHIADTLKKLLDPNEQMTAEEFFEDLVGEKDPEPEYICGWIVGASDLFRELDLKKL